MGGWASGLAVLVAAGDRHLIRVAAKFVKNAAKNAIRLNASLDIAKGAADDRTNQADALITLVDDADSREDVTIPAHLLRCAQIGVSLEIGKVSKAKKNQQEELQIEDTKGVDKRLLELERLARHLGIQGDLGLGEDEVSDEDLDVD